MSTICKVTIEGTRPLLMHNGRLADPLDQAAKALKVATLKKSKTDEDQIEIARIEFEGGLYWDKNAGPYIPSDNLQAMLIEGAKKRRLGKAFECMVEVLIPSNLDGYKLEYKGPRDPSTLWKQGWYLRKGASVHGSKVMRTRPRFPQWSISFEIEILDDGPEPEIVQQALVDAGSLVGLGDWSPRYGRFSLESFKSP